MISLKKETFVSRLISLNFWVELDMNNISLICIEQKYEHLNVSGISCSCLKCVTILHQLIYAILCDMDSCFSFIFIVVISWILITCLSVSRYQRFQSRQFSIIWKNWRWKWSWWRKQISPTYMISSENVIVRISAKFS